MKISAIALAAALPLTPAFAADWAPRADLEAIASVEIPAAAPAVKAGPKDGANYSGAEELLIKEFGITRISMDIPEAEVMRQDAFYNNAFCFEHALRLSLTAVLEDYSDRTSPLALALGEIGALEKPTKSDLKKARQAVFNLLDDAASGIAIVRPYKFNQPPNGEMIEKNWVVFLKLAGRPYWVVVDRGGEQAPYVYGTR
ncbi:MAG: hypothetical protein ACYC2I_08340 [Elusimicrobiales bacterium]